MNRTRFFFACTALSLAGCAVGPAYQRPTAPVPEHYKEAPGWVPAQPADAIDRGAWWAPFGDAQLNELAPRVAVSNQNVAAAVAAYAQARAVVRQQRAALFPTITLDGSAARSGRSTSSNASNNGNGSQRVSNNYQVAIGTSWEPDLWGRLRLAEQGANASLQASQAELASATLSAQGELVTNLLSLRETDAELALLAQTVEAYQRALQITQNRYAAGVVPKTDVLQAQTQVSSAQADRVGLQRNRAQLEHAIAVLLGQAPGNFSLPAGSWNAKAVPEVPLGLPSTLLQRRPDIAAAERRVSLANAQIGIARAAYFPSIGLSASYGVGASALGDLFSASSVLWSLGLSVGQTLFDAGARSAQVASARAGYDAAVAQYRQTVLTAFQDVEDQLAASRVLAEQQVLREQASTAADQVEQQVLNRYRSGQVGYSDVVTAQTTALSARRALLQAISARQLAAVALIQALGGGWRDAEMASTDKALQ
jgi:NodT family efflux transporter outer membrane factor (OMF) lipoprotein